MDRTDTFKIIILTYDTNLECNYQTLSCHLQMSFCWPFRLLDFIQQPFITAADVLFVV